MAKSYREPAPTTLVVHHTFSLAADMVSGNFFIADQDYEVRRIQVAWDVPTTSGTLQIQRLQGTEAPASGDDLLASTVDTSAAADTVTTPTLTSTTADLDLVAGDRLAAEWGGTVANGVAVTITVVLTPTGGLAPWQQ